MQQPLGRAKRWAVRRALDGVVAAQMSVMEGAGSLGKYIEGNEEIGEMMERGREVVGQCESMAGQVRGYGAVVWSTLTGSRMMYLLLLLQMLL